MELLEDEEEPGLKFESVVEESQGTQQLWEGAQTGLLFGELVHSSLRGRRCSDSY